jgi:hypothetical protein
VLAILAESLGLAGTGERVDPAKLIARFDPVALPRWPWLLDPATLVP